MLDRGIARHVFVAAVLVFAAEESARLVAQAAASPPSTSAARAKELVGLLQAKKLESFAARMPNEAGKFMAVLLVPNAQLLTISASYGRPTDMEYYLYNKEYQNAYTNLSSSTLSENKLFFEDALHDGLIALPGKALVSDAVRVGTARQDFNGVWIDPRRKNPAVKITQADYFKAFVSADEQYARILDVLIAELKKPAPPLAAPVPVR